MTHRYAKNNRLVYYKEKADQQFWDDRWQQLIKSETFERPRQGQLSYRYQKIFLPFLPRDGYIIEAGCGTGSIVMALQARGYDIEGVEWAEDTVHAINQLFPDTPIRVGDVTSLDVLDEYYSGYISLGVIEHSQEGPGQFLDEAFRILKPGGIAWLSVPHFHVIRYLKAKIGFFREYPPSELEFYQYAFTRKEFLELLENHGFEIIQCMPYDSLKGIRDELPYFLQKLLRYKPVVKILQYLLQRIGFMENLFGHMLMVICRKPKVS